MSVEGVAGGQGSALATVPENEEGNNSMMSAPSPTGLRKRSLGNYDDEYIEIGEKPSRIEVWGWYLYEFCSYFVLTVLVPVVFPLIISQLQHLPVDPVQDWINNHPAMACSDKEIRLYNTLVKRTITVSGSSFSSLEWTSIAWAIGLVLAVPILAFTSFHLDGQFQTLITAISTVIGVFFCFPTGFFKTTKIFIPYIAGIVIASTVATASHTHHLGLTIRAFGRPSLNNSKISTRQNFLSWFSIYATVGGCLGAGIVSSLTYHMLREPHDRDFISLWIVSIFSGLIWLVGVLHVLTAVNRTSSVSTSFSSSRLKLFAILKYPFAIGGLIGVFLSSFTTMCVFTSGVLFVVGELCIKPVHLLYFWLTYFLFPMVSLPLLNPLQHLIKANCVKMKILGFLLSLLCSGFGFYFWDSNWRWGHLLIFGAIQGTATGILNAYGRVLVMECAPFGKEGAFSVWYAWMRNVGLCLGFTVGSVVPEHIKTSFGAAICAALVGIVVLLFGNVEGEDDGVVSAWRVREDSETGSRGDSKDSVSV